MMGDFTYAGWDPSRIQDVYSAVGRPAFIHVNLEDLTNNVKCLRQCVKDKNPNMVMVAMVKGNAYGHGAIPVAKHLKSVGVERLGVATVEEGFQLRQAGIEGPIHLFGNVQGWEMEQCLEQGLIASVATKEAIHGMKRALYKRNCGTLVSSNYSPISSVTSYRGTVHIEVDTGMSRNGCQPDQLESLVQLCRASGIHLEGIFTHMANYRSEDMTQVQLDAFYDTIEPYRNSGMLFHVANSGSVLSGIGPDMDMIRPGSALYGLPGGDVSRLSKLGFKPIASVHGQASLVKRLSPGRQVGYGCTYRCEEEEWVVTIPVGFADFYCRQLGNKGVVIRDLSGERCPVIGRVSMDAITVKVTPEPEPEVGESFTLVTANYDQQTSVCGIAAMVGTIPNDITSRFQERLPRYYTGSYSGMISTCTMTNGAG